MENAETKNMTFRKLKAFIESLSEAQLDQEVKVERECDVIGIGYGMIYNEDQYYEIKRLENECISITDLINSGVSSDKIESEWAIGIHAGTVRLFENF